MSKRILTVSELIKILQQCNPDSFVRIDIGSEYPYVCEHVYKGKKPKFDDKILVEDREVFLHIKFSK